MEIRELRLSNFRCFGPEETVISFDDITTFVGLNSTGKTAVLYALLKLFAKSASVRELKRGDFHIQKGEKPGNIAERELYIEAVIYFPEIEEEEDATSSNTVPPFYEEMTVEEPGGELYARMRLEAKWKRSNVPEGDIDQRYYFITVPIGSDIADSDEHRRRVTANHRANIEIIYVPAVRDPILQLRNASGTILWRVWNGINWPNTINQPMKGIGDQVEDTLSEVDGFSTLQKTMEEQWRSLHTDERYNHVALRFNSVDLDAILKKLEVRFWPTVEPRSYEVDELGEGLRSLFYLSLVNSLLELEAFALKQQQDIKSSREDDEDPPMFNHSFTPPALTILAVEEPENHLAPHLLGRVMDTLHNIASKSNAQVIVTSHTPAIVKRVAPESIRHLRICREKLCTIANSVCLPETGTEAYKYVKEAVWAYPEIYFARLVVLGEGDTEEIVLPKALELLETTLDGSGISVVPLGGRYVNHFWRLLNELDIPHITLLDLDLGRGTGGWARVKYVIKQLVEKGRDLEGLLQAMNEAFLEYDISLSLRADDIESLHLKEDDREILESLLDVFVHYDIFFAFPLDMDFMMLKAFPDAYKLATGEGYGPRIPNEDDTEKYKERLESGVRATLKTEQPNFDLYTASEQLLMVWYAYLFLSRGKPGTHILALSQIEQEDFNEKLPRTLKDLTRKVKMLVEAEAASQPSESKKDQ
jgi:hypothetical protein